MESYYVEDTVNYCGIPNYPSTYEIQPIFIASRGFTFQSYIPSENFVKNSRGSLRRPAGLSNEEWELITSTVKSTVFVNHFYLRTSGQIPNYVLSLMRQVSLSNATQILVVGEDATFVSNAFRLIREAPRAANISGGLIAIANQITEMMPYIWGLRESRKLSLWSQLTTTFERILSHDGEYVLVKPGGLIERFELREIVLARFYLADIVKRQLDESLKNSLIIIGNLIALLMPNRFSWREVLLNLSICDIHSTSAIWFATGFSLMVQGRIHYEQLKHPEQLQPQMSTNIPADSNDTLQNDLVAMGLLQVADEMVQAISIQDDLEMADAYVGVISRHQLWIYNEAAKLGLESLKPLQHVVYEFEIAA
ncbi:hypothetical protein HK096_010226 [Nowakowskiella sp. JEL0078]|nr:hypothetical protein HK096_010226 [Nowakowskiella sp. JEL0078]